MKTIPNLNMTFSRPYSENITQFFLVNEKNLLFQGTKLNLWGDSIRDLIREIASDDDAFPAERFSYEHNSIIKPEGSFTDGELMMELPVIDLNSQDGRKQGRMILKAFRHWLERWVDTSNLRLPRENALLGYFKKSDGKVISLTKTYHNIYGHILQEYEVNKIPFEKNVTELGVLQIVT